jgi:hypothetical protein
VGVLDDAIRQHLELKRQHGASEDEVRGQEAEALGPPRREAIPAPAEGADDESQAESDASAIPFDANEPMPFEPPPDIVDAPTEVGLPPNAEDPEALVPTLPAEPLDPLQPLDPEEPFDPEEEPFDPEEEPIGPDEDPLEPQDRPAEAPPHPDDLPPAPDEGDANADDVLEETPDFLQETPEHDRLWFEQKPPRDFDFDDE